MSHDPGVEPYALIAGVILIGSGLYGILRSAETARKNEAHIESGEERYFEERRAWKHYGRPLTDPHLIRRGGWFAFLGGFVLLLAFSPVSIFHWS